MINGINYLYTYIKYNIICNKIGRKYKKFNLNNNKMKKLIEIEIPTTCSKCIFFYTWSSNGHGGTDKFCRCKQKQFIDTWYTKEQDEKINEYCIVWNDK